MKPRLLILIVLAGGLAVYFATAPKKTTADADSTVDTLAGDDRGLTEQQNKELITELAMLPLAGEEPPEAPDVSVSIEVDTSTGKNRLVIVLSESHGYYAESFRVRVWYKETPDMDFSSSPLAFDHVVDKYIKANETLRVCFEVVPAELSRVGGDIGTSENWGAEVSSVGRAREHNPKQLRHRPDDGRCDG